MKLQRLSKRAEKWALVEGNARSDRRRTFPSGERSRRKLFRFRTDAATSPRPSRILRGLSVTATIPRGRTGSSRVELRKSQRYTAEKGFLRRGFPLTSYSTANEEGRTERNITKMQIGIARPLLFITLHSLNFAS